MPDPKTLQADEVQTTPARNLGVVFQPSPPGGRPVLCIYSISMLINGATAGLGRVRLLCDLANPPLTERCAVFAGSEVGVGVFAQMGGPLVYFVPPAAFVKLELVEDINPGSIVATVQNRQEIVL